jgi:hypothetical protein
MPICYLCKKEVDTVVPAEVGSVNHPYEDICIQCEKELFGGSDMEKVTYGIRLHSTGEDDNFTVEYFNEDGKVLERITGLRRSRAWLVVQDMVEDALRLAVDVRIVHE